MMQREIFSQEHDLFREQFRRFAEAEVAPHLEQWNEAGISPRSIWKRMGEEGFLGANMPIEVGGAGGDFLFDAIVLEELAYLRAHALQASLHTDICQPYLLHYATSDQKRYFLEPAIAGELLLGIAISFVFPKCSQCCS